MVIPAASHRARVIDGHVQLVGECPLVGGDQRPEELVDERPPHALRERVLQQAFDVDDFRRIPARRLPPLPPILVGSRKRRALGDRGLDSLHESGNIRSGEDVLDLVDVQHPSIDQRGRRGKKDGRYTRLGKQRKHHPKVRRVAVVEREHDGARRQLARPGGGRCEIGQRHRRVLLPDVGELPAKSRDIDPLESAGRSARVRMDDVIHDDRHNPRLERVSRAHRPGPPDARCMSRTIGRSTVRGSCARIGRIVAV